MILALEMSSSLGSLAIGEGDRIVEAREFRGSRQLAALVSALRELPLASLTIETVIVGLGPGSFSSIRVSIAAVQAIAFAKGAHLRSLCSAWSLALRHPDVAQLGVFADARRGELYGTLFSFGRLVQPTVAFPREQLPKMLQNVDLAVSAEELGPGLLRAYPRAEDFLRLKEDHSAFSEDPFPEPIYLRGPLAPEAGAIAQLS
ncbi:tRNA (adenosine(37)-N6)-threonylcarbamoyltransferase complex dimerization subunit type 1 TsaB [Verrucomicrobium sp. 3C]|uniref:tRNA (adenosine(37)-N6)-threonylcarbamoyltransferase complex dimerization subunit type 1 TsaB n=1 Tax=Verrucomicrobium sp. 3C TaxID=1134055 RepID=UPI000368B7E9|nr:tRNA (adenosine(37)-N6)-threonylcarbamoyltransferase complex dimerization subunit type 1 TsaB [Verrucomicrobium sp. 3C]